jgi:hypothetical protein
MLLLNLNSMTTEDVLRLTIDEAHRPGILLAPRRIHVTHLPVAQLMMASTVPAPDQ